jgi:hypothetical protein
LRISTEQKIQVAAQVGVGFVFEGVDDNGIKNGTLVTHKGEVCLKHPQSEDSVIYIEGYF